jgi:hypothetical protein
MILELIQDRFFMLIERWTALRYNPERVTKQQFFSAE